MRRFRLCFLSLNKNVTPIKAYNWIKRSITSKEFHRLRSLSTKRRPWKSHTLTRLRFQDVLRISCSERFNQNEKHSRISQDPEKCAHEARSSTWEPTTTKYAVIGSISNPVEESTATFKSRAFINYRNASNSMHYLCDLDFVDDATGRWHLTSYGTKSELWR